MDMLKIEKECYKNNVKIIAGIDEAGRGPLAGPVVASCVVIDKNVIIEGVNDSKKLTPKKRDLLFDVIKENAKEIGIGIVHEDKIDSINILQATYLAMKIALGNIKTKPDLVLIDGQRSNLKHYNVKHIIKGDSKSQSIAAASIIAKVTRDRIMQQYDYIYPDYKFSKHKGYGTKFHIESIEKFKSTPVHRKSFKIVKSNLPSVSYIKKTYGFKHLAKMIVASKYIRNEYRLLNIKYNIQPNDLFDYFINKNDNYKFIKIEKNNSFESNSKDDSLYLDTFNYLKFFLKEKDIQSSFTFIVISVMFQKNKKPLINLVYKKKIDSV